MDTLTHALSGMLLARATAPERRAATPGRLSLRARLGVGFLAGAFPDIDFVIRLIDGPLTYLKYHRGVTHSIVMLPLWAWMLSLLFMLLWRGKYHWKAFYAVCAMSIGIHILGDVITSFGTMILAPLSDAKFAIPATFIIDGYFSATIVLALLLAWMLRAQGQRIAIAGLVCLTAYVSFQNYLGYQARGIGQQYAAQQQIHQAVVHILPQPVSPFNWKIMVQSAERYDVAYVNLRRREPLADPGEQAFFLRRIHAIYQPADQIQWQRSKIFGDDAVRETARAVWKDDIMADVRDFMLYPVLLRLDKHNDGVCAWFQDHRFILAHLRDPFRFGACRSQQEPWQLYRLLDGKPVPLS